MASGLSYTSLALTVTGGIMAVCIGTHVMRPAGDNVLTAALLLLIGFSLGLAALLRGDRSIVCKASLGISVLLLTVGLFILLAINATLRSLH